VSDTRAGERWAERCGTGFGWAVKVRGRPLGGFPQHSVIAQGLTEADARLLATGAADIARLTAALADVCHEAESYVDIGFGWGNESDRLTAAVAAAREVLAAVRDGGR
jgi:hypothetical protein